MSDPTDDRPADPPPAELPAWERERADKLLRWARGALPRDHPDHPDQREDA